jgi:glycosyltransferase involved in cell wall biosynthesis
MSEPVRLLILTHNYPRFRGDFAGGFIALLARKLIDHGIAPMVLAPHDAGHPEYEVLDSVPVYRFRYAKTDAEETLAYRGAMHQMVLGSVSGIFQFKAFLDSFRTAALKLVAEQKIQIIAGNWLVPSGIVMKTLAAKTELPMILSSHGTDIRLMSKYAKLSRLYFSGLTKRLDRWTVVSSYLKDEIAAMEPSMRDLLEVLPVPHDETVFYRDPAIQRENDLIVAVTRFTDQKRVDFLIKAFALVTEKHPSARLELYGGGPLQAQIEALISQFGMEKRVAIHPPVPQTQLRTVYNRAAISVLNSYREGFGLALSESMMCGACAVGTRSGGIGDIIEDGKTGRLVELDNSSQLAETLLQLLTDNSLRLRLAEAGHLYANATYASGPLASRYADIVKAAVAKRRS